MKEKIEQQRRHAQNQNGPKDQVPKESQESKKLKNTNNIPSPKPKEEGGEGNKDTSAAKFKQGLKDEVRKLKEKDQQRRHGRKDMTNLEKYEIGEEQQNQDGLKKTATGKKTSFKSSELKDYEEEEVKPQKQRTGRDWKSLKYGSGGHLGFSTSGKQGQLLVNVGVAVVVLVGLGIYASYSLN